MLEALATAVTAISWASMVLYPMSGSPSSKQGHADPPCRPGAATGVYRVAEPTLVKSRLPRIGERIAHKQGILAEKYEVEDRPLDPRDGQAVLEDDVVAEELAGGEGYAWEAGVHSLGGDQNIGAQVEVPDAMDARGGGAPCRDAVPGAWLDPLVCELSVRPPLT